MNLYQPTITGSLSVSGSINISGSINVVGGGGTITGTASYATTALTASSADNLTVRNTLTATTLVVQTITSSVDFVTGSTRFGSILANTHVFSGSVSMNPNGLFVSSSGLVGIGTTVPAYTLDVTGTGRFTGALTGTSATFSELITSNVTTSTNAIFNSTNASGGFIAFRRSSTNIGYLGNSAQLGVGTLNALELRADNNLYLTTTSGTLSILSTGNVGIGITSPSYLLDVAGTIRSATSSAITNILVENTNASGYALYQAKSNGSIYTWQFGAWNNGTYRIGQSGVGDFMTITTGGNVLIGTTSDYGTGNTLQVYGGSIRHYLNNETCAITHQGSMTISNGGTKTINVTNGGLIFISENTTGDGALFFAGYKSATVVVIADPNGRYAGTNTAGKACLYKSANSGTATFINNLGSSLSFTIYAITNSD